MQRRLLPRHAAAFAAATLVAVAAYAVAQDPGPLRDPTSGDPEPPPPGGTANPGTPVAEGEAAAARPVRPAVRVRGLVVGKGSAGSALLDVDGRDIFVTTGSVVRLSGPRGDQSFEVVAVGAEGVRLAFPGQRETVDVR